MRLVGEEFARCWVSLSVSDFGDIVLLSTVFVLILRQAAVQRVRAELFCAKVQVSREASQAPAVSNDLPAGSYWSTLPSAKTGFA